MIRRIALVACPVAVLLLLGPHAAHAARSGLVSPVVAQRHGLERKWFTHAELDRSSERISDVTIHVSKSQFTIVKEVVYGEGKALAYSENDLDRFGDRIGIDGATERAKARVEVFAEKGVDAEIVTHEIPAVILYVQTTGGTLHAIDGESGRTRWAAQVGKARYPTLKPGASDTHVAVINGSTLYVLNAGNGALAWEKQLGGAPGAPPAVSPFRVFCPLLGGRVEVYTLENPKAAPWRYQSAGHPMIQPTVAADTVSWSTDRGVFYVAMMDRDIVRHRLYALDTIRAHSTYSTEPAQLYVPSTDGYLYAMDENNGDISWRFSTGEPIEHPPIVIGDSLYVVTIHGGMYKVGIEDGAEKWSTQGVQKIAAVSGDRVYCQGDAAQLLIIDANTGGRIGSIPIPNVDMVLTNWRTDRIYFATRLGVIQCLHEQVNKWPVIHHLGVTAEEVEERRQVEQRGLDEELEADDGAEEKKAPEDPFAGDSGPDDPFGGDTDPFGDSGDADDDSGDAGDAGDDDPFGAPDDDPFGGDSDPFGTIDDDGDDDSGDDADNPFGGGDDPFGLGG